MYVDMPWGIRYEFANEEQAKEYIFDLLVQSYEELSSLIHEGARIRTRIAGMHEHIQVMSALYEATFTHEGEV